MSAETVIKSEFDGINDGYLDIGTHDVGESFYNGFTGV